MRDTRRSVWALPKESTSPVLVVAMAGRQLASELEGELPLPELSRSRLAVSDSKPDSDVWPRFFVTSDSPACACAYLEALSISLGRIASSCAVHPFIVPIGEGLELPHRQPNLDLIDQPFGSSKGFGTVGSANSHRKR